MDGKGGCDSGLRKGGDGRGEQREGLLSTDLADTGLDFPFETVSKHNRFPSRGQTGIPPRVSSVTLKRMADKKPS